MNFFGFPGKLYSTSIENEQYQDALADILADPNFQSTALLAITRDQLILNRALYDSLGIANREYPYVPASKAILTNESSNLAGFAKTPELLRSSDLKRKYIMPIGLTSGILESLRIRQMDATGDLSYRFANIVEVAVWKRNLLHEDILYEPKRFVFDTSKFIIIGRPEATAAGGDVDNAVSSPSPQTPDSVKDSIVVRTYTPDGNTETWTGKAYEYVFRNNSVSHPFTSDEIFQNHATDYYLKTFMKLTSGFDFSEDIFPFLEQNVFFDAPDPDKESIYDELFEHSKVLFLDNDEETRLNFDRLTGELRRSIFLSPRKYRNRIIYPKVFERTYCVFIDPETFEIKEVETGTELGTKGEAVTPETLDTFSDPSDEYTQYYVTMKLLPAEGSVGYEYEIPPPGSEHKKVEGTIMKDSSFSDVDKFSPSKKFL